MKQPVRNHRRVLNLYEKSREYQPRADEECPENGPKLNVKNGRNEHAESLSDKAHEQVDGEEASEAKKLERLRSHKVCDENVTDGAENLYGKIADDERDIISAHRIPAVEMFSLYHGKF